MTLPGQSDLAPDLCETLCAIGKVLSDASDPWWVIASAAAALHGARPITVRDVDVLLSENDARRVLPSLGLAVEPGPDHPRFRSAVFAAWSAHSLPVEFMAGFCRKDGNAWVRVQPVTRVPIAVVNGVIHVPQRQELEAMFVSFGRPKDHERAALLRAL